jgi:hypothetical protein
MSSIGRPRGAFSNGVLRMIFNWLLQLIDATIARRPRDGARWGEMLEDLRDQLAAACRLVNQLTAAVKEGQRLPGRRERARILADRYAQMRAKRAAPITRNPRSSGVIHVKDLVAEGRGRTLITRGGVRHEPSDLLDIARVHPEWAPDGYVYIRTDAAEQVHIYGVQSEPDGSYQLKQPMIGVLLPRS